MPSINSPQVKKVFLLLILLAVTTLVSGCFNQTQPGPADGSATTQGTPAQTPPAGEEITQPDTAAEAEPLMGELGDTASTGESAEFDIIAKQWEFQPSTITVNQGDEVKLNIKSIDVRHGIAIPAFGINAEIEPGKEIIVEFTADKKGTFEFACSVFCGSGHGGMTGQIIVN